MDRLPIPSTSAPSSAAGGLVIRPLVAMIASVIFLDGCTARRPWRRPTGGPPAVTTGALRVIIEPGDGYGPVDGLIAGARHTIDLSMYELADDRVEGLLIGAAERGVRVRVLLDRAFGGASVNQRAYSQLASAGVPVRWALPEVVLHQKTMTVDGAVSMVMTGNLTSRYYPADRDFVVIDRAPPAVGAIESVFADDWRGWPEVGGSDGRRPGVEPGSPNGTGRPDRFGSAFTDGGERGDGLRRRSNRLWKPQVGAVWTSRSP